MQRLLSLPRGQEMARQGGEGTSRLPWGRSQHLGGALEPYIIEEERETTTLQALFEAHHINAIDLLHIDTEGADYKILSQFDFEKFRPEIVLYEYKHLSADDESSAGSLLKRYGYRLFDYKSDTLAIRRR